MHDKATSKRLVLFYESENEHRYVRLTEECLKAGIEILPVHSYRALVGNDGIILDGKRLIFRPTDIFWAISNAGINHALESFLEAEGFDIWPSVASMRFSDKLQGNAFFSRKGIRTPETYLVSSMEALHEAAQRLGGFPLIVKKRQGSQGKYVECVHSVEELFRYLEGMGNITAKDGVLKVSNTDFIIQKYVSEAAGEDFRVLCLGNEALGTIRRTATSGFKSNISLGGTAETVSRIPELDELAKKIMREGNLLYAGIDFIRGNDGFLAVEVNTSAQFTGFERVTGINVAEKIVHHLFPDN